MNMENVSSKMQTTIIQNKIGNLPFKGLKKTQTCEETKQVNLLHDCVKLQCIQIPVLLLNLQILWRGSNIYFPILIIVENVFQMDLKWLK